MVLKANDRRTSCPCHDEFRGPRSDYVRQVTSKFCQRSGMDEINISLLPRRNHFNDSTFSTTCDQQGTLQNHLFVLSTQFLMDSYKHFTAADSFIELRLLDAKRCFTTRRCVDQCTDGL
ncbi:hypothetical protein TNCV_235091 [Trichonephila clavipes]|uniref:Uncharacterized protein n=1 Tax=Trichonephila clavipes TaxID=2585209 RepID=A0A8X6VJC6_TRICX|nr:hypothetical protein TNCV_235091 [Trichonephila clavipes]